MTLSRRTALGLLAAGAVAPAAPVRAQGLTTVRVGASLDDGLTPLLYALHMGMFRQRGLDIRLQGLSNGAVLATAVASGVVDIGKSSLMVLITAYARGVRFKLVAGAAMHTPSEESDLLSVLKDSPITSLAQANGKTIAVNVLQSLEQFGTEGLIDKAGGDSSTVKFIELPFAAMLAALEQGRADIAAIGNPQLTVAENTGRIRTLGAPYNGIASTFLIAGWFSSAAYAAANPSVVRRFERVISEATRYTNGHRDEMIPLVAEYSHIDPAVLSKMHALVNATSLDPKDIQPPIDAAVRYHLIERGFPASALLT